MSKGKKSGILGNKKVLALIIKGVFSPLKSIVENFLGALRHLFSNLTVVFMHYASVWHVFPKILKDTFKYIVRGLQR